MEISLKEKILCAANKVIERKGLNCFTLEEVAKEAGISKGGLLYHYPSKDKLIQGLIQYYMEQFDKRIDRGRWLSSLIEEHFNCDSVDTTCMIGLLAAVAMNQELLQPVRENRRELLEKIYELKDPTMGMIICLACYGMSFSNLFGIDVFSKEDMQRIHDRLMDLSQELL